MADKLKSAWQWMKKEIIAIVPAIIYFLIVFNLIYYTEGLALQPGDVRYFTPLTVCISALVMGKILIIANMFPFINLFPHKPLIYNIVWKTFFYTFCTFVLWFIETLLKLTAKYEDAAVIWLGLKSELLSPVFLFTLTWLAVTFGVFVIFTEFARIIGEKKIKEILLGK